MICVWISIHLMLRFILGCCFSYYFGFLFQYISCYGLSQAYTLLHMYVPDFNTSHVTVYQMPNPTAQAIKANFNTSHVTVYPNRTSTTYKHVRDFNTSHVTVYRMLRNGGRKGDPISIHLMLRFIPFPYQVHHPLPQFQYISCYGLSLCGNHGKSWNPVFQYISCYGLSSSVNADAFFANLFQYISCYGLSGNGVGTQLYNAYFNTSHVTVYLGTVYLSYCYPIYFNTSHVTVYLELVCSSKSSYVFQYISCYGLSKHTDLQ